MFTKPFRINQYRKISQAGISITLISIMILSLYSCEEKSDEKDRISIKAEVPESMVIGRKDTLSFYVEALYAIDSLSIMENDILMASIGKDLIGRSTFTFNARFIYHPNKTGSQNIRFYAIAGGVYREDYYFTIEVQPGK